MAWKNVQYENGKMRTSEGGGGGGSSTFADLEDVSFSNLQDGQVPKYNSATQKWENANESGGGGTVTDVKVDGQSVVVPQTGEANITMPTIPVTNVKVNGESVVDNNKEAQIKSYKEVTQSEYNALPDSKLNDGILYAIKDVGGSDGFPPLIYSDEEREVGVWRDGRPVYQKVIATGNLPNNSSINLPTPSNIKDVINYHGFIKYRPDTTIQRPIPFVGSGSNDIRVDLNSGTLRIVTYANWSDYDGYLVIQYTKTTDTPGSGTWTTQGALAHHYSTDEHIIGTWIDGKPLYEKTINAGNNINVGYDSTVHSEFQHNISGFKEAINLFICCPNLGVSNDSLLTDSNGGNICKFRVDSTRIYASGGYNHYGATADRYWYFTIQYTKTTD